MDVHANFLTLNNYIFFYEQLNCMAQQMLKVWTQLQINFFIYV